MVTTEEIRGVKSELDKLLGKKELLEAQILDLNRGIAEKEVKVEELVFLRTIVQEVATSTLDNLAFHISNIVSTALNYIPFPEKIDFEVEFMRKRKGVECNLWFVRNGQRAKPIDSSGGGALDVASFALRLTYWSLKRNRPVFILDEPFKYVSADLQKPCAEMVHALTRKMGVQVIMISHLPNINVTADREYAVKKVNQVSQVKEKE